MLPETFHQTTIVMSDRGIPASFRNMHVYGEHTFSFYNAKNERVWCKFHLHTQQGIKNLTDAEAEELIGRDRESHCRDLYEAIERGEYPRWTMYVQIMTEEQARNHYENPFDITKVWKHAELEQAAFTPAHVVPGIGFSPDKFLQGRLFVYGDAQRYRLGMNYNQIPVNRAKCEVHDYHRDGMMRVDGNYGGAPAYTPNSLGEWAAQPEVMEPPLDLSGAMYAFDPKDDPTDNCFRQGGDLYRLMTEDKRALLIENTARNIAPVTPNIKYRHAVHCYLADEEYGKRITEAMGLNFEKVKELSKLSNAELIKATLDQKMQ